MSKSRKQQQKEPFIRQVSPKTYLAPGYPPLEATSKLLEKLGLKTFKGSSQRQSQIGAQGGLIKSKDLPGYPPLVLTSKLGETGVENIESIQSEPELDQGTGTQVGKVHRSTYPLHCTELCFLSFYLDIYFQTKIHYFCARVCSKQLSLPDNNEG